jgi:hypothetical protein
MAEKLEKQNWKKIHFFSFLAILLPSLLAGFRDITVGIDLGGYVINNFNDAKSSHSLTDYNSSSTLEPLYLVYTYIITRFTDNLFWFLFIQQFLILSLIYSFAVSVRKKISVSLFWLIYLLFLFNESLNIVRQSFSMAIIIYSFRFLFERRILLHYACILLACTFHYSSIILFFLYPLYWILYEVKNKSSIKWILIIILVCGGCIYFYFDEILIYLISKGLISQHYELYAGYVGKNAGVHKTDLVITIIIWMISLITKTKYRLHGNNSFTIYTSITIICLFCGVYNDVAHRIALYVILMEFVMLLMHLHRFKLKRKRTFCVYLLILFLLVRFVNFSLSDNAFSGTVPYTSKYLGIE